MVEAPKDESPAAKEESKADEPMSDQIKEYVPEQVAPTEAEKLLEEEARAAKEKLVDEINQFKPDQEAIDGATFEEEELPRVEKFIVVDPAKVGGTVKYTVAGVDDEGDFRCNRRFKEFHALSVQLRTRWPGVYIPSMPEKKLMNNTDSEVVEERRQLLQKFL